MEPANKQKENVLLFVPNLIGKTFFPSHCFFYIQMHFHITCVDLYLDSSAVSSRRKPSICTVFTRFLLLSVDFNIGFVFPVQVMS